MTSKWGIIGFVMVHRLNESHKTPYTDMEFQTEKKYQTYVTIRSQYNYYCRHCNTYGQIKIPLLLQAWQHLQSNHNTSPVAGTVASFTMVTAPLNV